MTFFTRANKISRTVAPSFNAFSTSNYRHNPSWHSQPIHNERSAEPSKFGIEKNSLFSKFRNLAAGAATLLLAMNVELTDHNSPPPSPTP